MSVQEIFSSEKRDKAKGKKFLNGLIEKVNIFMGKKLLLELQNKKKL